MKLKTNLFIGLAVLIVETSIFVLLIFGGKPEPSVSIGLIVIAPFLFGLNIILGLMFYFRKSKQIATIVFINSIVSPIIFYFIWTSWYSRLDDRNYSQYSFNIGVSRFEILLSKNSDDFSIADITNQQNGSTTELYYGKYRINGDSILMISSKNKMFILNKKLYEFPRDLSAIDLH